ncbi:anaphase-promoting complex subunit 11 [Mycena alexandri]|uniref:Anaphase-promoting complex subunit 11 n=1 Tax=Mycena alexandri TaxID=1745969 RepID=A0AAD6XFI6_9AGAR|nr:anaphase-promoting complex subunit 11 [Mycena alexandri]
MKVTIKHWHAVAQWRWDTGPDSSNDAENEDVCGICRVPYEGCCPSCKVPGDDCPLIWGECTHVFHMHCLLKWIGTPASKGQCPMDRRTWVTAERTIT